LICLVLLARERSPYVAQRVARSIKMLDLIVLAIGLGFFALSVGYTIACDRL
jgi:hypothetical protein